MQVYFVFVTPLYLNQFIDGLIQFANLLWAIAFAIHSEQKEGHTNWSTPLTL